MFTIPILLQNYKKLQKRHLRLGKDASPYLMQHSGIQ